MPLPCKTTGRHRDSQRHKVYAAEEAISINEMGPIAKLSTAQKRADKMASHEWVQTAYPHMAGRTIQVKATKSRYASACETTIRMPEKHLSVGLLLHELAHVIHLTNEAWSSEAAHGWRFCSIYLNLVQWFVDRRKSHLLEASFKLNKVAYC